jgi:hypothetical protein
MKIAEIFATAKTATSSQVKMLLSCRIEKIIPTEEITINKKAVKCA